jgi:hypothetical protein
MLLNMLGSQQMRKALSIAMAGTILLTGCHRKKSAQTPLPPRPGPTASAPEPPTPVAATPESGETGLASWYGHPYHGRASASGEIYDMEQMTAAHRTLPFGAMVRVHDLDNRKVGGRADQRPRTVRGWADHRPVARGGAGHRDDRSGNGACAAGDSERARRAKSNAFRRASGLIPEPRQCRAPAPRHGGEIRPGAVGRARGYSGLVARGGGNGTHGRWRIRFGESHPRRGQLGDLGIRGSPGFCIIEAAHGAWC